MEFWNKYKSIIITILVIAGILIGIYLYGQEQGKKYVPNDIIIPPDLQASGTPDVFNAGPYTDALFRDMDCTFCLRDSTPYSAALSLSNSQLAAVYNDWNKRYASQFDGMTIIQAINDERTVTNLGWTELAGALVRRFKSLYGAQG